MTHWISPSAKRRIGNCTPSRRIHSHTCRTDPSSANRSKIVLIAPRTASSGSSRISPSSSPHTSPIGSALRSSPRAALLRIPPSSRARSTCNSASLIVPFSPSSSRSLNEPG